MASTSFCGFINLSQSETVPWEHWEPTATHSALLLPHWPAGGDRAAERTQTCGGRQRGVELTQTCRGRQGAGLLPEAATAEQWDLQFSPTKLEIMALTVQTKPRPPGSDPDTRKNDNNYRKRVSFTLTLNWLWIRIIHLQQELSSRTGSSCSTVQSDFSLREGRSNLLHVSSSSSSTSPPPPHLSLIFLRISSSFSSVSPPLETDVDLFGQLSVQVVNQSVEILQTESAVKRSIKIQELIHVQTSSSRGPCILFLLCILLFIPAAWNSNMKECLVYYL